jgi:hypothetical protein
MPALVASVAIVAVSCGDSGRDDQGSGEESGKSAVPTLFTQSAAAGSFEPVAGEDGVYGLRLTGVSARTTWFTDRPERDAGTTETGSALAEIGFDDPPNAVVSLPTGNPTRDAVAVTLEDPDYDVGAATLNYRATILDGGGAQLAGLAEVDGLIPRQFDSVDLFIDDAEPNGLPYCNVRVVNRSSATYVSTSAARYPDDAAYSGDRPFFVGGPRPSPPSSDYLLGRGERWYRQATAPRRVTCGGELHLAVLVDGQSDTDHVIDMWWKDPPEEDSNWDCNVRWAPGRYPYPKPTCMSEGNVTQQPLGLTFTLTD